MKCQRPKSRTNLFGSSQGGIYALGKAHMRFIHSVSRIAFKMGPDRFGYPPIDYFKTVDIADFLPQLAAVDTNSCLHRYAVEPAAAPVALFIHVAMVALGKQ